MTTTPLPPPDTHCWDEDKKADVWSYSAPLVEQIVTAARADLESENARLREALAGLIGCIDHGSENPTAKLDAARAALRETP